MIADLPLNVSREILQNREDIEAIRNGCSRRVLSMLEDLANARPATRKNTPSSAASSARR